jgi:hypothetical protein
MNSDWCLWYVPLHKRFRNRPRAWGVTSQFPTFVSHRSSACRQTSRLMVLATPLTAVLLAGSRVTCHSFLNDRLCFSRLSRPGRSLLRSESVILLLDRLYAEAIEAVNSRAALSASSPESVSILGEIYSEARLWNHSKSVNFSNAWLLLGWCPRYKTPWHGPSRKHRFQHFLYYCAWTRWRGTYLFRVRHLVKGLQATILTMAMKYQGRKRLSPNHRNLNGLSLASGLGSSLKTDTVTRT